MVVINSELGLMGQIIKTSLNKLKEEYCCSENGRLTPEPIILSDCFLYFLCLSAFVAILSGLSGLGYTSEKVNDR